MKKRATALKLFILPGIIFAGLLWAIVWANGSKEYGNKPYYCDFDNSKVKVIIDINGVHHVYSVYQVETVKGLGVKDCLVECGSFSSGFLDEPNSVYLSKKPEKDKFYYKCSNGHKVEIEIKCAECREMYPKACSSGTDKCDWACIAHRDKPDPSNNAMIDVNLANVVYFVVEEQKQWQGHYEWVKEVNPRFICPACSKKHQSAERLTHHKCKNGEMYFTYKDLMDMATVYYRQMFVAKEPDPNNQVIITVPRYQHLYNKAGKLIGFNFRIVVPTGIDYKPNYPLWTFGETDEALFSNGMIPISVYQNN